MTPIEAAYESAKNRMDGVSFEQFAAALSTAEIHPLEVEGQTAGAIVVIGPEIHVCVLPWAEKKWANKRAASVLNDVIEKHGYATTHPTTKRGEDFVKMVGFVNCGDYWKKETRYGR